MGFTFEYHEEEYFEKYGAFIEDQVNKYYDLIKDTVAFIGWKIHGRDFSKRVRFYIEFDPFKVGSSEKNLTLELTLSGKRQEKIEFKLLDETDLDNVIWLGNLVFKDLPSWSDKDDKKLLKELKKLREREEKRQCIKKT